MSAFTDALDRLEAEYYNSLPKTTENPGGLAADGHVENFPAALKDTATLAATMATWISTLGGDDLAAVNDFADQLIETDRTFDVYPGYEEQFVQTVQYQDQPIYLGRIYTGTWELLITNTGTAAYDGARICFEKLFNNPPSGADPNVQISHWSGYADIKSFHSVAVSAYQTDIFVLLDNPRSAGNNLTTRWSFAGASTSTTGFSRPAGVTIPTLDASNEIKVGIKVVKNKTPTIGHNGIIINSGETAGDVGTLVFAKNISGSSMGFGTAYSGSNLSASSTQEASGGTVMTGTWQCLGEVPANAVGLFVRTL